MEILGVGVAGGMENVKVGGVWSRAVRGPVRVGVGVTEEMEQWVG